MTVQTLIDALELHVFSLAQPGRSISGGYCGDLLSWVISRAEVDSAWLTIMSNVNVAAVATLSNMACVVLTEGVEPDPNLLTKVEAHGINLLGTRQSTFNTACALAKLL